MTKDMTTMTTITTDATITTITTITKDVSPTITVDAWPGPFPDVHCTRNGYRHEMSFDDVAIMVLRIG